MNEVLHGDYNIPRKGFTGVHAKALWMCNATPWRWYQKDQVDPNNPTNCPLYKSKTTLFKSYTGVWIYGDYYYPGFPDSIHICDPGIYAKTIVKQDPITFCPLILAPAFVTFIAIVD